MILEASECHIHITRFNKKIYLYSTHLNSYRLKAAARDLFSRKLIFTIAFKPFAQKRLEIDEHIEGFIEAAISHNRKEF